MINMRAAVIGLNQWLQLIQPPVSDKSQYVMLHETVVDRGKAGVIYSFPVYLQGLVARG